MIANFANRAANNVTLEVISDHRSHCSIGVANSDWASGRVIQILDRRSVSAPEPMRVQNINNRKTTINVFHTCGSVKDRKD